MVPRVQVHCGKEEALMLKSYIMNSLNPRDPTPAEIKLGAVTDMLFPDLVVRVAEDGLEYVTDYSIDTNLHAALVDLEEGQNDQTTRETIRKCLHLLREVREYLGAEQQISKKARYLVVDAPETRTEVD